MFSRTFERVLEIVEENLILIAVFILTVFVLGMIKDDPTLTENEGFMYLATGIIITGLVNGIIQKNNERQQRSQAETVQTLASANAGSVAERQAPPAVAENVTIETETTTVTSNDQPQPSRSEPPVGSSRPSWLDAD